MPGPRCARQHPRTVPAPRGLLSKTGHDQCVQMGVIASRRSRPAALPLPSGPRASASFSRLLLVLMFQGGKWLTLHALPFPGHPHNCPAALCWGPGTAPKLSRSVSDPYAGGRPAARTLVVPGGVPVTQRVTPLGSKLLPSVQPQGPGRQLWMRR